MQKYIKNSVVLGTVTGVENYGIFVSIDKNVSGLIHISEISDGFVKNIGDYVSVGESIRVRLLDDSDGGEHLKLSIKNMDYKTTTTKNRNKIKETSIGFKTLEQNLNKWVSDKKQELI